MAYVSYSPVRESHLRGAAHGSGVMPVMVRSALVAAAAAVAIFALSEASVTTVAATQGATALSKADRMAAPQAVSATSAAGYFSDPSTRTTTVERGAVVPLTPQSPLKTGGS